MQKETLLRKEKHARRSAASRTTLELHTGEPHTWIRLGVEVYTLTVELDADACINGQVGHRVCQAELSCNIYVKCRAGPKDDLD